jgi:hypothetical protein
MDNINHPAHYTDGKIEVIDYIEDKKLNFNLGNAVKYISRAGKKGNKIEDLKKAIWYLYREIYCLERFETKSSTSEKTSEDVLLEKLSNIKDDSAETLIKSEIESLASLLNLIDPCLEKLFKPSAATTKKRGEKSCGDK